MWITIAWFVLVLMMSFLGHETAMDEMHESTTKERTPTVKVSSERAMANMHEANKKEPTPTVKVSSEDRSSHSMHVTFATEIDQVPRQEDAPTTNALCWAQVAQSQLDKDVTTMCGCIRGGGRVQMQVECAEVEMLPAQDSLQAQHRTLASDIDLSITKLEHLRKMPRVATAKDTRMCGISDGKHFVAAKTNGDGACSLHSVWGDVIGKVPELFAINIRCRLSQGFPRDPAEIQQHCNSSLAAF